MQITEQAVTLLDRTEDGIFAKINFPIQAENAGDVQWLRGHAFLFQGHRYVIQDVQVQKYLLM